MSFALLLTIALGVGGNAALYGFLQGLTHPASPVTGSDRIVSIVGQDRYGHVGPLSSRDYQRLGNSRGLFEWTGAARIRPVDALIDGQPYTASVAAITPNLAICLGMQLDKSGVVISHRIWENEFGKKENPVGAPIQIDNAEFRVAGVAPDRLDGLYNDQSVDLWIQSRGADLDPSDQHREDLWVLARLRDGVSVHQAQTALGSGSNGIGEVRVTPFTGIAPSMARGLARVGMFLNFSAGAVFFIACINIASFLLGRALRRSHETSLRVALGATRAELLWDLFSDSLVISVAGGTLGLLLGVAMAHSLPAFLFESDAERLSFAPHFLPILTASLVCIAITIACGMAPVLGTITDRPWTVLQRETGSPSIAIVRLRSALVVGQIIACCMLVICSGLLLASLHSALKTSEGQRLGNPILLTVQAAPVRGPEIDVNYFYEVEQSAKAIPGLSPLAWTARLAGNQPMWRTFRIQRPFSQYREVTLDIAWITEDSLQSLETIAGSMFGADDPGQKVAVVNNEAAAELFGRQTVGQVIGDSFGQPIEIIGVVRRRSNATQQQSRPTIYYGYLDQADAPSTVRDGRFRVPLVPPAAEIELSAHVVSANYFHTLDMPLIAGEAFLEEPIPGQGRVAVINQEAAALYFDDKPLGASVIDDRGVRTNIIGIVGSQVLGTFEQHAEPAIYFPIWQDTPARMTLMLKASNWNKSKADDLEHKIENVPGGSAAPIGISTLDAQLAQSGLAALRIATLIGGVSAATALLLSILGLLSTQSDSERQRQRDRAIRIALGAQRWRIVLMVVKNAGWLAFVGIAAGTSLSFALMRFLAADLTGISSPPLRVWLIAPLLPAVAVIVASMIPARQASVVSPSSIMRDS